MNVLPFQFLQTTRGKLIASVIVVASVGAVVGAVVWQQSRVVEVPRPSLRTDLASVQPGTPFPLYYMSTMPTGVSYEAQSVSSTAGIVTYSLQYSGQTMVVTEQPRPANTEEVVKTREFATSIGSAYVADLNGRVTGFLKTDKTLVIISSSRSVDATVLEQLLRNLTTVQ